MVKYLIVILVMFTGCSAQWPLSSKEVHWALQVCAPHKGLKKVYPSGYFEGSYSEALCNDSTVIRASVEIGE